MDAPSALDALLGGSEPAGACVVACWDPRLDRFIGDWDRTFVMRVPGAVMRSGRDLVRAVAYAVYVKGSTEVVVMAHGDCGLARLDTGAVAHALRRHGVAREGIEGDLRAFLGAFGDPRAAARETAQALREAPELPPALPVHAALIDTKTGRVALVERGHELTRAARAGAAGPARGPMELADTRIDTPLIAGGYPDLWLALNAPSKFVEFSDRDTLEAAWRARRFP